MAATHPMSSRVMPKNSAKTATRLTPTDIVVSPMTLNLKGEEMPTHATVLENTAVSPMTMNLKCEVAGSSDDAGRCGDGVSDPNHCFHHGGGVSDTLYSNGEEKSTHATVLEDMPVSPMTMNLKCEVPVHPTTLEGVEMVFPIPTIASTMEAVSPMTLYSNGEGDAGSCNDAGRCTDDVSDNPGLERRSEDEVENGKHERDLGNYPIPVPGKGSTIESGRKSRRNERGYDLEKLWIARIGTGEGEEARTIQYPVTSK
ncbi:hypothetical protein BGY98DRAFT_940048 [Russula aff. rugulosa BPL654]|nr:hypothetical protein BGY98DRAFT_940048 [Russula aff. rugulosa BPL654]